MRQDLRARLQAAVANRVEERDAGAVARARILTSGFWLAPTDGRNAQVYELGRAGSWQASRPES
jgi:hypothetical protein